MKQPIYLHIPEPCNEDWNKMSATQQGRYCESCCKQVIDFSLMTDHEILNHITKASGKTCGRFMQDQLMRPLEETKIETKKGWKWLLASTISLLMINRSEAQQKSPIKQCSITSKVIKDATVEGAITFGAVMPRVTVDKNGTIHTPILVRGVIKDDKGMPLPGAVVTLNNATIIAHANGMGEFSFTRDLREYHSTLALTFSSLGCESLHIATILQEDTVHLQIVLKSVPKLMDEVVVSAGKMTVVGALRYYPRVTKKDSLPVADTLVNVFNKVFNTEPFTMYPNPAAKGSQVHVQIKEAGSYAIQLLDNQSRLLSIKETTVFNKEETAQLSLSYTLPSAIYYVRVVNTVTGKQSVNKLLVQ